MRVMCFEEKMKKQVRFKETPQIRFLYMWKIAHQQARIGQWEQCGRDRVRFERRIVDVEYKIEHVFHWIHREKIYNERFNNNN